jgi:hypothetical protein
MKKEIEIVHLGATLNSISVFLGLILISFGIYLIAHFANYYIILPGLLIIAYGVYVGLAYGGITFNFKNKTAHYYSDYLFTKLGYKTDLSSYVKAFLTINHGSTDMNSRSMTRTVRTRSYDVCLVDKDNKKLLINEFTDIVLAQKTIRLLAENLDIPFIDEYQMRVESSLKKRASGLYKR